ncbi:hypothetical protein JCM18899A_46990 [Nocardioides sp. AN3]
MAVRAVRGATQLDIGDEQHMYDRVAELVSDGLAAAGLSVDDLSSAHLRRDLVKVRSDG